MNRRLETPLILFALAALTAAIYGVVFRNDYVDYDDNIYITANAHTPRGLTREGLAYAWTTVDFGNWIPVTWTSYLLDVELFGASPQTFHGMNLAWHLVNVLLLFRFLQISTGKTPGSAVVAALFAAHPLHVESVAWAAERKDVLSAFWLLCMLFAYRGYVLRPGWGRYSLVLLTFVLGLLSKPMVVTAPLLLLLLDYWPLGRFPGRDAPGRWASIGRLVAEKVPLLAASLAIGIVTILAQRSAAAVTSIEELGWTQRLANVALAYGWYVWKTVWPFGLAVSYAPARGPVNWAGAAAGAGLLLAVSWWVARRGGSRGHLVFGWLWHLVSLLPVIGLLHVGEQLVADRYSYIPHIGLLTMLVWEAGYWIAALPGPRRRTVQAMAVVVPLAVCSLLTVRQIGYWRNTEALWSRALALDPQNALANYMLGHKLLDEGRFDEAERRFAIAVSRFPGHAPSVASLGMAHQHRGEYAAAEQRYLQSLALDDSNSEVWYNLASVRNSQEKYEQGREALERSLQLKADLPARHVELAMMHRFLGEPDKALAPLDRALQQEPDFLPALLERALTLENLERTAEAMDAWRAVLRVRPGQPQARERLRLLESASGAAPK